MDELGGMLVDIGRLAGFDHVCYQDYRMTGGTLKSGRTLSNYPEAWLSRYRERAYLMIDPIAQHAMSSLAPLIWCDRIFETTEQRELRDGSRLYGAFEERYRDAHAVELVSGGWLDEVIRTMSPDCRRAHVNSLHGQGIAALANGLSVDAYADDGTIEAVSHIRAPIFGVQWHPEWYVRDSVLNRAVWARFGRECAAYFRRRFDARSCRDTPTRAGNIPKDDFSGNIGGHGHLF
ncbi:gamma-glutamyl-gamma-aminobutyrate hydrolase family protein [Burkholderia metallica]|uniref:gamma-glutamyl-gamma-aminobutyrate hydrolase family protein n=1 Tax=Burkholderia metallica TaxID=488729 RepID=UPI00142E79EE|nr:gamma-glutamyl-gamma-aminobutyrate hydrolase family protein [Burkholderia metallica]